MLVAASDVWGGTGTLKCAVLGDGIYQTAFLVPVLADSWPSSWQSRSTEYGVRNPRVRGIEKYSSQPMEPVVNITEHAQNQILFPTVDATQVGTGTPADHYSQAKMSDGIPAACGADTAGSPGRVRRSCATTKPRVRPVSREPEMHLLFLLIRRRHSHVYK